MNSDTFVMPNRVLLVLLSLAVFGCATQREPQEAAAKTLRICDSSGCNDRPGNYTSMVPTPTAIEDPKMVSLQQLAANDPRAAYDLALRYFRGDGARIDHYQSIQWMRKAAEGGHFEAQKALGRLYLTGLGETGPDYAEAQKWLSMTASRGDKEAVELLKEANDMRAGEIEDYQARRQWELTIHNNWSSGYRYYWNWRPTGGWSLY